MSFLDGRFTGRDLVYDQLVLCGPPIKLQASNPHIFAQRTRAEPQINVRFSDAMH